MSYTKGLSAVPYPIGTPEWESFKNYVKAYYREAMQLAADVSGGLMRNEKVYMAILNATLSPLVFLWEKWQLMKSEQRLPYATPKYKAILEGRIKQVSNTVTTAVKTGAFQSNQ